jgi:hypothetical protein
MSGIILPVDAVGGAPSFPAAQNRVADAALMLGRADRVLGAVSGIRPGADPVVSINAARVWTATPTNGIIDPGTAATVGPYRFAFVANETGTLDPADASFTRFDRLDIQVPDDPPGAAPLSAIYVVTKGVPAASPTIPGAPARSFPVGVFTVPNVGSPSFAATYPYCAASGGITPVRSGVRPANPFVGQYIDDAVLGLMRYTGVTNGWKSAPEGVRGKIVWDGTHAVANGNLTVPITWWQTTGGIARGGASLTANGIVVPIAGDYTVLGKLGFAAVAAGKLAIVWCINGMEPARTERDSADAYSSTGQSLGTASSSMFTLAAGDVISMIPFQSSGAAVNLTSATLIAKLER